jgi:hypothetical protein
MRPVDTWLTTLTKVRGDLEISGGENSLPTTDDSKLMRFINDASDMISRETIRDFVPIRETRTFDASGDHITSRELTMYNDDLVEIATLANGDGTTISSSDYLLRPSNVYPKYSVLLKSSSGISWTYEDDYEDAISIDGYWVAHQDWPNAFVATNDTVQDAPLSATATGITVSNATGTDARGRVRFEVGMLIRVETEYMIITDISGNTLTVIRGARGTTATEHVQDTPIDSYAIHGDIEQACTSLVIYLYRNGALAGGQMQIIGSDIVVDNDIVARISESLIGYRKAL